jgi:hypothetical protein
MGRASSTHAVDDLAMGLEGRPQGVIVGVPRQVSSFGLSKCIGD